MPEKHPYYMMTCAADATSTLISIERLLEVDNCAVMYVAMDARAPYPLQELLTSSARSRVFVKESSDNSLCGAEFITAELQNMLTACDASGSSRIVKLDADAFVNSVDWLWADGYDQIVSYGYRPFVPCGFCSLYSRRLLESVLDTLRATDFSGCPPASLLEDQTIHYLALQLSAAHGLKIKCYQLADGKIGGCGYAPLSADDMNIPVIHAGEMLNGQRAPREHVAMKMHYMRALASAKC